MEYANRSNYHGRIYHPESEKEIDTFEIQVDDKTGKKELVKVGKTNVYKKIQANLEETQIYNILDKFNAGNPEIVERLQRIDGVFGDFTNAPKSLAEAQQKIIDAHNEFLKLPSDVRKEFNNSTTEFLAGLENGKIEEVLKKFGHKETPPTVATTTTTTTEKEIIKENE